MTFINPFTNKQQLMKTLSPPPFTVSMKTNEGKENKDFTSTTSISSPKSTTTATVSNMTEKTSGSIPSRSNPLAIKRSNLDLKNEKVASRKKGRSEAKENAIVPSAVLAASDLQTPSPQPSFKTPITGQSHQIVASLNDLSKNEEEFSVEKKELPCNFNVNKREKREYHSILFLRIFNFPSHGVHFPPPK